jgi:formamidopyrimidine-DNA glycosylase
MPELPEVETVRSVLSRELAGKKIKTCSITNGRVVRRHKSAKEFRDLVEGRTIKMVQRLGKYLIITFENQRKMVIHLGMSGQILRAQGPKDLKPKHTHVVFTFHQGPDLRYVDPRTFGELFISMPLLEGQELELSRFARLSIGGEGLALRQAVPELAHLGVDFLEDQIGWDRLAAILRSRTTPIKAVLTDQDILCGIGNIYADETLYQAGVRYDRPSESLSTIEIRRLHRAITETLNDAIKHRGSTLADEQFVDPDGKPGEYQQYHKVYGREGQPCHQCRTPIERVQVRGRSTFFCPKCQN